MTNYGWFLTVVVFGILCWYSGVLSKDDNEPSEPQAPWKIVLTMWIWSLVFLGSGFAIRGECTILNKEAVKTAVQQTKVETDKKAND